MDDDATSFLDGFEMLLGSMGGDGEQPLLAGFEPSAPFTRASLASVPAQLYKQEQPAHPAGGAGSGVAASAATGLFSADLFGVSSPGAFSLSQGTGEAGDDLLSAAVASPTHVPGVHLGAVNSLFDGGAPRAGTDGAGGKG